MRRASIVAFALCALACKPTHDPVEPTPTATQPSAADPEPIASDEPKTPEEPTEDAPPSSTVVLRPIAPLGVAECDAYLAEYMRCIEQQIPEPARQPMWDAAHQLAKGWSESIAAGRRASVAENCRVAHDAAKQATEGMGCTWSLR